MTTLLSITFGTLLITYVFFVNNSVVWYLPIKTDTSNMDIELEFVDPEEEGGLEENEEGEGHQPKSGGKSNKCYQCNLMQAI